MTIVCFLQEGLAGPGMSIKHVSICFVADACPGIDARGVAANIPYGTIMTSRRIDSKHLNCSCF